MDICPVTIKITRAVLKMGSPFFCSAYLAGCRMGNSCGCPLLVDFVNIHARMCMIMQEKGRHKSCPYIV